MGRKEGGRERGNGRQRARGEERRKQVLLNKHNMWTESGVGLKEEGRKKGKKRGLEQMDCEMKRYQYFTADKCLV